MKIVLRDSRLRGKARDGDGWCHCELRCFIIDRVTSFSDMLVIMIGHGWGGYALHTEWVSAEKVALAGKAWFGLEKGIVHHITYDL